MKPYCNLRGYFIAAAIPWSLSLAGAAQSYPNYVVDAQVPFVASDGFNDPQGLVIASDQSMYVADKGNHRVLKFSSTGTQSVVSFGDLQPSVNSPGGIALDGYGDLYVTDTVTNRLIKLAPGAANGLAIIGPPSLNEPTSVAVDAAGNLAIVNAGSATVIIRRYGGAPVPLNTGSTVLIKPTAVAFDNQGLLYVADAGNGSGPGAVYRFAKTGGTGVSVGPSGYPLKDVTALILDGQRNLFVLDSGSEQLIDVPASGATPLLIPQSNFKSPSGVALDSLGNFYVSDGGANTVTKFVYQNAANFGSVKVGATSNTILFNYEFYIPTAVEATRGIGGGVWNEEYKKASGGTCMQRTYYPSTSGTGLTIPAACTVALSFTPTYPGGRPGAVELQTSNGNATQLTIGVGLGGQLALLNAPITTKLGSINNLGPMVVNYADTEIYYCGPGGTYKVPVAGGTPTLVTTQGGVSIALNGVGDLFLFNPPTITKIPADGSASTVINVSGLINPQAMAMDSNGAFYIIDLGPPASNTDEYGYAGFVVRVSPAGITSMLSPPGYWVAPSLMTSDGQGNIYVADGAQRLVFEVAAWTGNFTILETSGPTIGGFYGTDPGNLAVDASGTFYFWDTFINGNFTGAAYSAPNGPPGPAYTDQSAEESQIPFYTEPPISNFFDGPGVNLPFHGATGNQTLMTSPNGKLYFENGAGPGVFVVDRTQGYISWETFNPNPPYYGGSSAQFYVYNVGNQNTTFTDATRAFTESGNGAGSFTFSFPPPPTSPYSPIPCQSGITLAPGSYCVIGVTDTTPFQGGPIVTDTLHFLTDAVNNNSVSFKITGFGSPAP
jgi:sugar lactone lactonase YvrE